MIVRLVAFAALFVSLCGLSMSAPHPAAALYPALSCVSEKQQALGDYCESVLSAWAKFGDEQDAGKRDARIDHALGQLDALWASEEAGAAALGRKPADDAEPGVSRAVSQSFVISEATSCAAFLASSKSIAVLSR